MKIENTLPRYVRLSYFGKDKQIRSVEFAPEVNDISAEDYDGLKGTEPYKGYIKRGDFVEVKATKAKDEN